MKLSCLPISYFWQIITGEMFYVITGKGSIRAGEEIEALIPAKAVWIPEGIRHQLLNDGNETLKMLWVLSPPGRERAIIEKAHPRMREE
jgi:mannose-6-phosphate isomerase-like protein (cupin superfamily)